MQQLFDIVTRRAITLILSLACTWTLLTSPPLWANLQVEPWQPIYQGVDFTRGVSDGSQQRPQIVTAIRVDLSAPGLSFTGTSNNGRAPLDTVSQTTSEFLTDTSAQLAINTSFYTPCCTSSPQNKDIVGLAVSDGVLVSSAQAEARAALLIDDVNLASLVNTETDSFSLESLDTAFAGSNFVLGSGRDLPTSADVIHPARTLVGLGDRDQLGDNGLLFLLTIDDGLPGRSEGATRRESAEWLMRLGAHTGANLDGGGSTLLATRDESTGVVTRLNAKVGSERSNANHLGIFAAPLTEPAASQFTPLWFAGLPDNSVADFATEDAQENSAPGSASQLDDDYYFAGEYPAPIGNLPQDEPLINLERAVIAFDPPNDRELRFHFNLTEHQAAADTSFRYFTSVFQQDGAGAKTVELELRFNGVPTETFSLSQSQSHLSATFSAQQVLAKPGANELSVTLRGGDAAWTSFDFHRLDIRVVPEPSAALLGSVAMLFGLAGRQFC